MHMQFTMQSGIVSDMFDIVSIKKRKRMSAKGNSPFVYEKPIKNPEDLEKYMMTALKITSRDKNSL